MENRCKNYVGVACVNGTCPKANVEEYEERCMPVVKSCKYCFYYEGCKDCFFNGRPEFCGDKNKI